MTDVKTKKTTVGELGANLPLGLVGVDGTVRKEIIVRPWRMKEEKALAKIQRDKPDMNMSQYVGAILGTMCQRIGSVDFDEIKDLFQKQLVISQMRISDVFYAYVWLRIQAIGPELHVPMKCPKCKTEFTYTGDLTSTEVTLPENEAALSWTYELKHPFEIRGKLVKGFQLGPQVWSGAENADQASMKSSAIVGAIQGFTGDKIDGSNGIGIVLMESELDDMSKYDFEVILKKIEDNSFGPLMALEVKCPKTDCDREWLTAINWQYQSFFGASSI